MRRSEQRRDSWSQGEAETKGKVNPAPSASTLQEAGTEILPRPVAGWLSEILPVTEGTHTPKLALNRPCLSERQGTTGACPF